MSHLRGYLMMFLFDSINLGASSIHKTVQDACS